MEISALLLPIFIVNGLGVIVKSSESVAVPLTENGTVMVAVAGTSNRAVIVTVEVDSDGFWFGGEKDTISAVGALGSADTEFVFTRRLPTTKINRMAINIRENNRFPDIFS
jgi:hypothetical protein